MGMTNR